MKVYFTSDTHYWHKSIIEYADRPFRNSFDGMICNAKTMFDNYNAIVKDEDVDSCIEAITLGAHTGKIGDGKIFVTSVDRVVRIRTGEENDEAI